MTQIYEDGTYLANNPGWHEEDSPWKAKYIDKIIKKTLSAPILFVRSDVERGKY